ncbi:MAG: gamma-glutamyl-gamma-aminobutyrate hydrolase family protein [Dehalococcoidia bacterium]
MLRVGVTTGQEERIERYLGRVRDAGLEPITLNQPGQTLEGCAGLVLTGGVDVDPVYFREERHPRTQEPDPVRDEVEFALLREAIQLDLPVLAICRGLQVVNVALGGSLLQHIDDWSHYPLRDELRTSAQHEVSVSGILADLFGSDRVEVNSRHHQAVTPERLAAGLEITSMSDDGYVEGFVDPSKRWLVAVQWHPEREDAFISGFDAQSRKLFEAFARAVNTLAATEAPAATT